MRLKQSYLLIGVRSLFILLLFVGMSGLSLVWRLFRLSPLPCMPRFIHRSFLLIMGIDVTMEGTIHRGHTLFVSNHCAWLDIAVLGAQLFHASFVSKGEVQRWPLVGLLCWWQETIFIDRRALSRTREQRSMLADKMQAGRSIILFPEGTTSDGNRVLPFKSSLFDVAYQDGAANMMVQPISIAYYGIDGNPMGRVWRPFYAWYSDMAFMPHLMTMLGLGRCNIRVIFHEPVRPDAFPSRKQLATYCQGVCDVGLRTSLYG
ncbi:MAG: 1-acyl-sn-glycerol-3-phosphate acyltransferase [Alphaproteobacteria bacterium GM202ARS2]|nr:1-acyl-sn-glycerol-3-phosphate acyltransferase [Alphaproteobacteria bacterium GM202ARS2]